MPAFSHSVHHMFYALQAQLPGHHFPSIWEDVRIMNGHITSSKIQFEARSKLLDHLHSSLDNFNKRDRSPRSGVVGDSEKLIPVRLPADHKGGAMVRTQDTFPRHVVRHTGRNTIGD